MKGLSTDSSASSNTTQTTGNLCPNYQVLPKGGRGRELLGRGTPPQSPESRPSQSPTIRRVGGQSLQRPCRRGRRDKSRPNRSSGVFLRVLRPLRWRASSLAPAGFLPFAPRG